MAVLIEAISVIVRTSELLKKFPGGWDAFKNIVPNQTLCADNEIVRVGFMAPEDVESFIRKLQMVGLEFLRDGEAIDIAVADQTRGLTSKCTWLEFGHVNLDDNGQRVAACQLVGSRVKQVVTPPDWKFKDSLSSTFVVAPSEHVANDMKYLRHENGLDVYLDPITGQEMYVGRNGEA
jgi:hypothetical protein